MFRKLAKLRRFDVKFFSTNHPEITTEAINISKREDYYKDQKNVEENIDVKQPGWDEALPFESIPGPKPLPLIGNFFRFFPFIGEFYNLHMKELHEEFKRSYGNIMCLSGMGRDPIIYLFDVQDMEKLLRSTAAFPIRRTLDSITYYRTVVRKDIFKGVSGLISAQGAEWFKIRSVVNSILMQPRTVQQYVGNMDKVANKLIDNIRFFSKQSETGEMPADFQNELYKWALESIGFITLNKNLGCLDLNTSKDSESQKLISSANELFLLMYELEILPPIWRYVETPTWKRFVKVLDFITETFSKYIEEALSKGIPEDVPEHQLTIIQRLAKQDKRIAFAIVMDMLMAGIDTTGKTMAAVLYFLAKNPDKQQCLREELCHNLPQKNSPITQEVLNNSLYLRAVIKEAIRIAPIAVGNVRTTTKDSVFRGYKIPKGTELVSVHIASANSEEFKDHEKFIPERWLRTEESDYSHKNVHPFAYQPFGFGPRSCIGRRFANLELEIAISKIIRNFALSWPHEDMVFSGYYLYGVDRPLRLRVKEL